MAQKNFQQQKKSKGLWLYGFHPVMAALENPNRRVLEIWCVKNALETVKVPENIPVKIVSREQIDSVVGVGAVHQGVIARCEPLSAQTIEDVVATCDSNNALVVVLDQVSDPHNVGAVLRSAAAFGASAVVVPDANAPEESGVLAKSASGTLELVPLVRVANLARTMEYLKKNDFWCIGMDGYATQTIGESKMPKKCVVVMGGEGDGMRRLTAEKCDYTVRLPMDSRVESLNVSNACAIALYEWYRSWKG